VVRNFEGLAAIPALRTGRAPVGMTVWVGRVEDGLGRRIRAKKIKIKIKIKITQRR